MTTDPPPVGHVDGRDLLDHRGALGELTDVFLRRQIATGIDTNGGVVLVRPKTLLVDCRGDAGRRALVERAVGAFNEIGGDGPKAEIRKPTARPAELDSDVPPLDVVAIDVPGSTSVAVGHERRWSLSTIRSLRQSLTNFDPSLEPEYCTVVMGSQNVRGNPVGSSASFAGEVAFVADTATINGRTVMLTTAEPSVAPVLRDRLDLPTDSHHRPKVLVLDTGLSTRSTRGGPATTHQALGDSCRLDWSRLELPPPPTRDTPPVTDDEDEVDDDGNGTIDFEAGHGTFIAGVVRQLCPDAEIYNAGVLSSFGDGDVFAVLDTLARVLPQVGPVDVVVMSFGLFFADDDPGLFGPVLQTYLGASLGVAAAGNQNTCRPYFPAALPGVISVGGLAAGGKAWFSNFGPWVDACAPAVDVVSTFFDGIDETLPDGRSKRFEGWARWSGTSFSAPKVAAVIAQEMYLHGGTAKEAWKRLTSHQHYRYPDLGIVFNV